MNTSKYKIHIGDQAGSSDRLNSSETVEAAGTNMDYYIVLEATDFWGLTAGKFDHSGNCRGRSVTFVHMEVRSVAGAPYTMVLEYGTRVHVVGHCNTR